MLENEDSDIICWTSDGMAGKVLDRHKLENTVLTRYFKHSKFASFLRQLNYFGFKKHNRSRSHIYTFAHPYFRRNQKDLLCNMSRYYGSNDEDGTRMDFSEIKSSFPTMTNQEEVTLSIKPALLPWKNEELEILWYLMDICDKNKTLHNPFGMMSALT
jgi:hypothetical protein